MHWLREAEALQIWRPLGMVSALDYWSAGSTMHRAPLRTGCGSRERWAPCPGSRPHSPGTRLRSRPSAS
jgi:hypothetical protein